MRALRLITWLLLASLWAVPAEAAFVVTSVGVAATASGTSVGITVPVAGVSSTSLVVLGVNCNATITDTGGNTYTKVAGKNNVNIFFSVLGTGLVAGNTITATCGGAPRAIASSAISVTGAAISNPEDRDSSNNGNNATPDSSKTGRLSNPTELAVGFVIFTGVGGFTNGGSFTQPPNFTSSGSTSNDVSIAGGSLITSSTTGINYFGTLTVAQSWTAIIATFVAGSGGGGGPPGAAAGSFFPFLKE